MDNETKALIVDWLTLVGHPTLDAVDYVEAKGVERVAMDLLDDVELGHWELSEGVTKEQAADVIHEWYKDQI